MYILHKTRFGKLTFVLAVHSSVLSGISANGGAGCSKVPRRNKSAEQKIQKCEDERNVECERKMEK